MPNEKKNHIKFYNALAKLMIQHGIRDIKHLNCKIGDSGKLLFNRDHIIVPDDDRTYLKFGDDAESIIRESLMDLALKNHNKELFDNIMNGDIISKTENGYIKD